MRNAIGAVECRMRRRIAGRARRGAVANMRRRRIEGFAVHRPRAVRCGRHRRIRPCAVRNGRHRRPRPCGLGLRSNGLALARRVRRLHDGPVRIHELHVAHRPRPGVRAARHADRVRPVVGRHVGPDDRRACARHVLALSCEMRGRLVAIRGRHGRIARRDERVLADRRRRTIAGRAQRAGKALAHRRNAGRARHHVRVAPLPGIDVLREARDRLAVHERGRRHGRDRVRRAEVHVRLVDVRDVGDVRHVHGLVHRDVVDHDVPVHAVVVMRTPAAPAGMPRFARAECEPCATGRGDAAHRQRDAPVGTAAAAHERDERRRVDGRLADDHRAGHPRPAVVDIRPAAVVVRREAPWRVVDPGPAPRRLPDPVAVVIRRPVGRRVVRNPHRAVIRRFAPRAVRVEILVAGDVARHVAGRHRALLGCIAACSPLVERIGGGRGRLLRDLQVGAGEDDLLPRRQRILPVAAVDGRAAAAHGDGRARAVRRDVDAIVAWAGDAEREIRRVDFVRSAGRQRAHVRRYGAEADLQLRRRVVEVQHRQARRFAEPHRGRADVQLRARAGIVPQLVARGQRPVHGRVRPGIGAGRLRRHGARHVVQPRDAARRVAARLPGRRRIRRRLRRLRECGGQDGQRGEREQRAPRGSREGEQGSHDERLRRYCRYCGALIRAVQFTISARPVSVLGVL
ncbi:hypothetical protein BLA24064_05167 [Burkholderia latens]|uniref:Uncharacterized protein n=1 Tax=Burkholderia latens TaxID=488446 RepID=A0A6P2PN55_9BURK|nr:hypothetical protein BLA24064_05167 [Burkholderia latens]